MILVENIASRCLLRDSWIFLVWNYFTNSHALRYINQAFTSNCYSPLWISYFEYLPIRACLNPLAFHSKLKVRKQISTDRFCIRLYG